MSMLHRYQLERNVNIENSYKNEHFIVKFF